ATSPDGEVAPAAMPGELTAVLATIGSLVVYGLLLEPLGFIPSTILVVAAIMIFVLRLRTPIAIAAMAIGLSLGCYLVFGKLLGTYLPPGTWITIYI
ncbi:MAG: tripartite tricarboxylate transporter TctB family protein, partial [Pseudolabrys sp.]